VPHPCGFQGCGFFSGPLPSGQSRQGRNNVAHRGSGGEASARCPKPHRGGTSLTKNVIGVIFHAMLLKQPAKFFLETRFPVVRLLILDVSNHLIEIR
jgi:hypothetical protein